MTKVFLFLLVLVSILPACQEEKSSSLADLVDLDHIEKAEMFNNSGAFILNPDQLSQLKKDLSQFTYAPGMAAKTGAIRLVLTIGGEKYAITSSTHGDFAEINASMLYSSVSEKNRSTVFFRTNGVNLDNYKE